MFHLMLHPFLVKTSDILYSGTRAIPFLDIRNTESPNQEILKGVEHWPIKFTYVSLLYSERFFCSFKMYLDLTYLKEEKIPSDINT